MSSLSSLAATRALGRGGSSWPSPATRHQVDHCRANLLSDEIKVRKATVKPGLEVSDQIRTLLASGRD